MNCPVCVLLLRALRGSGGESENYVTEMTSSGLEPSFCCAVREGRTRKAEEEEGVLDVR